MARGRGRFRDRSSNLSTRSAHGDRLSAQSVKEKLRKRRATVVNKIIAFAQDCEVEIYLLIQDKSGKFFEYKTKKDASWPPLNAVRMRISQDLPNDAEFFLGTGGDRRSSTTARDPRTFCDL
jgi:hypothetical protein